MSLFLSVLPEEREELAPAQLPLQLMHRILPVMSRAQFMTLIGAIISTGLLLQVYLNLQLSQGAFVESGLQQDIVYSNERLHELQDHLMQLRSTKSLILQGQKLHMVDAPNPVSISLSDGEVHGIPVAAPGSARTTRAHVGVDTSSGAWSTDDGAVLVSRG